jgi:hypothetical protein
VHTTVAGVSAADAAGAITADSSAPVIGRADAPGSSPG